MELFYLDWGIPGKMADISSLQQEKLSASTLQINNYSKIIYQSKRLVNVHQQCITSVPLTNITSNLVLSLQESKDNNNIL